MEIRRPWEPSDDDLVWVGEALSTLSADQKQALDYWMGFLAAQEHVRGGEGAERAATCYLSLLPKIEAAIKELPEARKRATREFDPRKLIRSQDVPDQAAAGDFTEEELARAAEGARGSGGAEQVVGQARTNRKIRR